MAKRNFPVISVFLILLFNVIFNVENSDDNRMINEHETVGGMKNL
jgi:hypothetical protein